MTSIEKILEEIAKKCVPEKIPIKKIMDTKNHYSSLQIQILNNRIYTFLPVTEGRHINIINQLKEVLKYHILPNVMFIYNTLDQYSYPDWDDYIFTHAKPLHVPCNFILAPCYSFDTVNNDTKIYDAEKEKIYNQSLQYMNNYEDWIKKEDTLFFTGCLYEDRKLNIKVPEIDGVKTFIQDHHEKSNFIELSDHTIFKYLLNLNGCGGGWSTRLKFLLMCGSLAFYVVRYHLLETHINNINWLLKPNEVIDDLPIYYLYNIEYWMYYKGIHDCINISFNVDECSKQIEYYKNNPQEGYVKAKKGFDIIHELLSKENVLLYWKILLETYHSRCDNEVNKQLLFNEV